MLIYPTETRNQICVVCT